MLRQKLVRSLRVNTGYIILIFLVYLNTPGIAQNKIRRLPFRMANNLIILPAQINDSDTLYFILDTGVKNSIICELAADETLELKEVKEIRLQGLGPGDPVEAIQSERNTLRVGGLTFPEQDYLVLSNNILQLSNKMGTRIHGILSMQAFYDQVVEIDYDRQIIYFIPPGLFKKPKHNRYASIPMQIESEKPFIVVTLTTNEGQKILVKLLIDSGASNSIWLDINSLEGLSIPENRLYCYLGCGISGEVQGMMSRVNQVDIGPYNLQNVLVSYPDSSAIAQQESVPGRNGSLGSEILKRFNVIFDFPGRVMYLRPGHNFSQKFHYDMSGIELMSDKPDQNSYVIAKVREGSTADQAGTRAGDRILSINKIPVNMLSLDDVYRNLLGKEGKSVKMVILRGDEKLKLSFQLEKYI